MSGMDLIPVRTRFVSSKVRRQVSGRTRQLCGIWEGLSGIDFSGYEIHMGQSMYDKEEALPFSRLSEDDEGSFAEDGICHANVCGTYVHGIFDNAKMQQALVAMLMRRKGLDPGYVQYVDNQIHKENQYDHLAEGLRQSLDMERIYRIMRKKES
jgi:adenosylcobyric acid synthase